MRLFESGEHATWLAVVTSLVVLGIVSLAFGVLPLGGLVQRTETMVNGAGPLGPLVFVVIVIVAVVIPPVPERPLQLSAGLLFDLWLAVTLVMLGVVIGAILNFLLARRYARPWLRQRLPRQLEMAEPLSTWQAMLLIRMFAGFTFDLYSYLLGSLRTNWAAFLAATAVGILPGVFAEVYAGSFLTHAAWVTFTVGFSITAVSLIPYLLLRRRISLTIPLNESEGAQNTDL